MQKALTKAEQSALDIGYDVQGVRVELDADLVTKYLVRGNAELVTPQEVLFFMNTCKAQKLNPLVNGEVYLVKYAGNTPAQMVIGKGAYLRRATSHPDYLGISDGITVQRGNEIIQKRGTCLYEDIGEKLIGGWAEITYERRGKERTVFKEVALKDYDKGRATWKDIPATMINKVAISQCARDAFPQEFSGLYSEDELVASGAIPAEYTVSDLSDDTEIPTERTVAMVKPTTITQEQRKAMAEKAKSLFGERFADIVKLILIEHGYENSMVLPVGEYDTIMTRMDEYVEELLQLTSKADELFAERAGEAIEKLMSYYPESISTYMPHDVWELAMRMLDEMAATGLKANAIEGDVIDG